MNLLNLVKKIQNKTELPEEKKQEKSEDKTEELK